MLNKEERVTEIQGRKRGGGKGESGILKEKYLYMYLEEREGKLEKRDRAI